MLEVLHQGEDCWGNCGDATSGTCPWCGLGNACCKKGNADDPNVCGRAIGYTTRHHECVRLALPPRKVPPMQKGAPVAKQDVPPQRTEDRGAVSESAPLEANHAAIHSVLHRGEDCWIYCNHDNRAGFCEWCGARNACCKKGFAHDPPECVGAIGFISDHHECVAVRGEPNVESSDNNEMLTEKSEDAMPLPQVAPEKAEEEAQPTLESAFGEDTFPLDSEVLQPGGSSTIPKFVYRQALSAVVVVGGTWLVLCCGAWKVCIRPLVNRCCRRRRRGSFAEFKSLEGDVDPRNLRRRSHRELAFRKDLQERTSQLDFSAIHVLSLIHI